MKLLVILFFSFLSFNVLAHEGHKTMMAQPEMHQGIIEKEIEDAAEEHRPKTWTQWIGSFHLTFLHFPIALINMVVVAEFLFWRYKKAIFESSARFMLIAAAILTPLTAVLGLIYSYSASYQGLMETLLQWHMWLGILTTILTIIAVLLRERCGLGRLYYWCLALLFLMVNITACCGGCMTFGPSILYPPV